MSGSRNDSRWGFRETVKMTGSAMRMAMFMRWRVKIRLKARFRGLTVSTAAVVCAGLSVAGVESMALRYLPNNPLGKQNGEGTNTRWYCRRRGELEPSSAEC